jgi:hypothetical protein
MSGSSRPTWFSTTPRPRRRRLQRGSCADHRDASHGVPSFERELVDGMNASLARIKAAAESG